VTVAPVSPAAARTELESSMTPLRAQPVEVCAGSLADEAEMLGAISLVARQMTLP